MDEVRERLAALTDPDQFKEALVGAGTAASALPEFDALDYSRMARSVVIDGRRVEVDRNAVDVYEGLCW